jgi:CHAT domain
MSDKNTPAEAGRAVVLTLCGQRSETPRLPACLTGTGARLRSADGPDGDSAFFPPGFLVPHQTIELTTSARRRGDPVPVAERTLSLTVAPGDLVVLELADGGVFITLGERLQGRQLSTLPLETQALATSDTTRGLVSDAVQEQIRRLHVLRLGRDPSDDGNVEWLGDKAESLFDGCVVGLATRWLAKPAVQLSMAVVAWGIEQKLLNGYGLRRWRSDTGLEEWPLPQGELARLLPRAGQDQPLLIFLHELGSNTLGSFGALQGTPELVELGRRFSGGIYGFDHPTLSCSPIKNARMLVDLLPQGAHISLVTHGRGGLVGDVLCLHKADDALLDEGDRADLGALLDEVKAKGLKVQRYLRVASPAAGTQLLGESLEGFLSAALSVVGSGANLLGPWAGLVYGAFKRLVIDMVRHRADPELVPGLAPLMPGSKLTALLQSAKVQDPLQMAVLAGDTNAQEGLLRSLGLWLLDKKVHGTPFHDLVVDAPSMLAGIAKQAKALARLDARPEVNHFRYFQHAPNVRALKDWLCEDQEMAALPGFESLEAVQGQMQLPDQKATSTDARSKRSLSDAGEPSGSDTSAETPRLLRSTLRRKLTVSVHAADLRFLPGVLMVGHHEQDPIAGPQAVLDRELLHGLLTERHNLGLYPGPIGSALAVLPKGGDTQRGAVIVGLGRFEAPLTRDGLTEAVMAGVLRYLLQVSDCHGPAARGLELNTLLIGTNSASSLSMGASVEALVRGVLEANARFHDTTRQDLRVERLRIVELYLDTAITATYALKDLDRQQTLRTAAALLDTQLVSTPTLEQHDGARPRLFDGAAAGGNYWPRLMVTDARRGEAGVEVDNPPAPAQPASVATWLRYLHLGQRARVETVEQQRQPGLVEQLVRQQIQDNRWNPDAGRALFHLMVPHALKDTLRHFGQLVVVVDAQTANMPWELVAADDPGRAGARPRALALCIPLVRQLVTAEYRPQLRQSTGRAALVIGNPALDGFSEHFVDAKGEPLAQPVNLPGAGDEARTVAAVLRAQGHDVTLLADDPPARAADVVMALYRQPWRILHVCAHGVFALRSVDGVALTGVLLSNGAVISAAEIQAMELVPELVFLNCCHLGQMTAPVRAGSVQRLAASLARELRGRGGLGGGGLAGAAVRRGLLRGAARVAGAGLRPCRVRGAQGRAGGSTAGHHLGSVPGVWRSGVAGESAGGGE